MAQTGDVQVCTAVDPVTHDCTASVWMPSPSALPTMSIADAQEIGLAIAVLWAIAWGIKMAKKVLNEVN